MKILFPHTDSFGGFGGIAKFNRDFLTALCATPECEEVVALPRLAPESIGKLPERLTCLLDGLGGKLKFTIAALCAAWRKRPCALVVCGHIHLLPVAWLCAKITDGRLGLLIYGIEAWQPTGSWLVNSLVRKIDFFISISEFTKQKFSSWSGVKPDKGHLLPNSIDLVEFTPGAKNPALLKKYHLENRRVIITFGRISASEGYKGFDEVLEALPGLARENPEISYLVVGDGDDRPRLERKAQELGVADRVVFAGRISEEEKVDHYRLADLYVMPSRGEGFGFVFLEALACGIPCIGSTADGSREALREGMLGQLVDPGDQPALRKAILAGLGRKTGEVPPGLEFFSFANFSKRVHNVMRKCNK